jgi:uncharacterized C2H2 Zn-finger protein
MAMRKKLKCPQCSRRFGLPGHLARHVNAIHGAKRRRNPNQTQLQTGA